MLLDLIALMDQLMLNRLNAPWAHIVLLLEEVNHQTAQSVHLVITVIKKEKQTPPFALKVFTVL